MKKMMERQKSIVDDEIKEHPLTMKLKAQPSACSLDSDGYPSMISSPKKTDPAVAADVPKSFLRKRIGSLATEPMPSMEWKKDESNVDLKGALGYEEVLKRPAAKKGKVEPATDALPKAESLAKEKPHDDDASQKPWLQLKTTFGKSPAKAYICGSHDAKDKVKLIVEVTEKRSSKYKQIIEHILHALKTQHLTKNQALEMRTDLCLQFP